MSADVIVQEIDPEATISAVVARQWAAAQEWLESVRLSGGENSEATANTYRFHVAKLRWFCEHEIRRPPSAWAQQDANAFVQFLRNMPARALCAQVATGRTRAATNGNLTPVLRFVRADEFGYTPYRTIPSAGSRDDIVRCARALFSHLVDEGVIGRNPLAKIRTKRSRKVNASRAVNLDLFQYVLDHIATLPPSNESAHRIQVRDRFAFIVLRELGLRASELIGAKMRDLYALSDPRSQRTYWVLRVSEEHAKGGQERTVPVTQAAMDALISYRKAFGLAAIPASTEPYGLLLSTRTAPLCIGGKPLTEALSRRYFKSWASLTSRKTLYQIVTQRLRSAAASLREQSRSVEADLLEAASPHWLRHTFAKAALLKGVELRVVAQSLGHANIATTMGYTVQDALDQIREYERADRGMVVSVSGD